MKKFILGFVVALVLCGIAFGVFMIVNKDEEPQFGGMPETKEDIIDKQENEDKEDNNEKKVNIIREEANETERKNIVYPLCKYKDDEENILYSIPYINMDFSQDVYKTNREIEGYYKYYIEEAVEAREKGYATELYEVKFNSYVNDNILSLVISEYYEGEVVEYRVYNMDINKGTIVSNEEILNLKNISEVKYLNELEILIKDIDANIIKCSMETPIFLNEKGKISVVATIDSVAGASYYFDIIDTNI